MSTPALAFQDLSKVYRVYPRPADRLIEAITGRPRHEPVYALRSVSGRLERGEVMGLIGENGSGKSTLLKILAGTTPPTTGEFTVPGRIASILELGASFHPEVTGRQNAVLQAALTGLSRSEIDAALPEIEAFAELGEFFERPVKTYSSGMSMRLAFAVATAVLPDVVILDEALAVGDARFQKKCIDRIFDLKSSGRTIFFCSHALYYISTFCDHALWLRDGLVAAEGRGAEGRPRVRAVPRGKGRRPGDRERHPRRGRDPREDPLRPALRPRRPRADTSSRRETPGRRRSSSPSTTRPAPSSSTSPSRRPTTSSASPPTRASTAPARSPAGTGSASGSPSRRSPSARASSSSSPTSETRPPSRSTTSGAT